ncbi:MAG: Fructose-bisphosphate aldolase class 1 [Candidatus Heimdallarchaeota archaeon LC_3]|nr:MAG: Fructose-bisphosphate aldolase class 1 [Candidatus Heimdallarchaeota archaeon LC_3]
MSNRINEILNNYKHENAGVRSNIVRILNHGTLTGTGKVVILPVDQGFEHGPIRTFGPNPSGYDPLYHVELAIESGCNAYAAPLGFIQMAASEYPGQIPMILKINNNDSLYKTKDPIPSITSTIEDALQLGCGAIGYTIYPGTANKKQNFEELQQLTLAAKENGLAVVVWSYPRGSNISKEGETGIDIASYAAQIACQMGANIVKVKPPTEIIEQPENKKVIETKNLDISTLSKRIELVVKSAFDGKRIIIFSGGAKKDDNQMLLEEIKQIHQGGGFGSIVGRNAFQRPKKEAIQLLNDIMTIYKS